MQPIITYQDACQTIEQLGILPLSSFIPGHPSLEALTQPSAWHTGLETDPWLWRAQLAEEGVAAYGRFLAGKPLLVKKALFPALRQALQPARSVEERFADGLVSRATLRIYKVIREKPGIDARELRKVAGLQSKEHKNDFEHALIDLQGSGEMVIAGTFTRLNAEGVKSGWSSMCYDLSNHWLTSHGLPISDEKKHTPAEACESLIDQLKPVWSEESLTYLRKKLSLARG